MFDTVLVSRGVTCLFLTAAISASVPEPIQREIDCEIGVKGVYVPDEGVYKVVLPRDAATIVLDYQTLSPNLGLNSWAAFSSALHHDAVLTGRFLLLDDEVNPVITLATRGHLKVTGLAPFSVFDGPRLYALDVTGNGTFSELASDFRKCLDEVVQIRRASTLRPPSQAQPSPPIDSNIDAGPLNTVLSIRGVAVNGVYHAAIGRRAMVGGEIVGRDMGISTWFSFAGKNEDAVVHGEFVSGSEDLNVLLQALRSRGIDILSIRNHLAGEHPPLLFVHFRTEGNAIEVAKSLRYALDMQVGRVH